jgi:hypothetical protein
MMINNNEEVFKMGGWEPVYQDIKYMGKKYTVYNNFNEEDEYLLIFGYHGTPREISIAALNVDLFYVNFLCRFDTKFRFEDCNTGVVYEIDGSCEKTREQVRLFKHDEDGYYEYNWCREVGPTFDPNFFKVGHPYLVKIQDTQIPMLLVSMDTDGLYFRYFDHGEETRFNVTSYSYEKMSDIGKETSFVSLMYGDVWTNKKKEVEF